MSTTRLVSTSSCASSADDIRCKQRDQPIFESFCVSTIGTAAYQALQCHAGQRWRCRAVETEEQLHVGHVLHLRTPRRGNLLSSMCQIKLPKYGHTAQACKLTPVLFPDLQTNHRLRSPQNRKTGTPGRGQSPVVNLRHSQHDAAEPHHV